eukprot:7044244-Alexandrium_andersonii.AAC.1
MSASLVGSEMCIRDSRSGRAGATAPVARGQARCCQASRPRRPGSTRRPGCLLYTSDAADDM